MLYFTGHAQRRLAERNVTVAEVEQVCQNPDTTYNDPDGNPCRVADVGVRRIKVVVASTDTNRVITVIDQTAE